MKGKRVWLAIVIAALCFSGEVDEALAQGKLPLVEIRVESILATLPPANAPLEPAPASHMDRRLSNAAVGQRLRETFDFSNYHLIRTQQESTHCGQPVAFNLPGGHILHVQPFETDDDGLAISVMLFEGLHPIMQMPFRTELHSMLFLVDQHLQNSLYITAISVESVLLRHQHHMEGTLVPQGPTPDSAWLAPAQ